MPTSSASKSLSRDDGNRSGRDRYGGFSMLEVVLALVLLGLLASLGLPFIRPHGGATALRAQAFEVVALLRADRNAAIASGVASTVFVDPKAGSIRSGRTESAIVLPNAMSLRISAANASGFRFYPNGQASGGQLSILSGRETVEIAVSGPTAMVSIMEPSDARH